MWSNFKVRLAAAILGGILGLLLLLLIVLHTPPVRRFALKQAIQILGDQGITFDAQGVEYNLFSLSASLRDVTVQSKATPDLPPLAHADLVRLHLSLRELVRGKLYVKDGEVSNPVIRLVVDEKGRDNIPQSPNKKKDTSDSTLDYLIDYFVVRGGSVRYEDRRQHLDATLPLQQLVVDGNPLTNQHDIRLATGNTGHVTFQQRTLPLRGVSADLQLQKDALDVRSLRLGLGDSTVQFAGKLNNFKDPSYDLRADTNLALNSLIGFAGVKQRVDGTIHAALTASGPLNRLKATARIDGNNLSVERFDRLDLKAEAAYDSVAQRLRLDSFNIFSPAGTIQGKSDVALTAAAGTSTLNAAIKGLDLARVSFVMNLPVRVASKATGDVAARWPALDFDKATGNATIQLEATRGVPGKNIVPLAGRLNARTTGRQILIGIPSLRSLGANASGELYLRNNRDLSGRMELNAPDLAATVAGAEALLGRKPGTLLGTPVAGSAQIATQVGGTVIAPAVQAVLTSRDLSLGTLTGLGVSATLGYNPAMLTIQTAKVDWRNQTLNASGTIGLKGKTPALNLQVNTANMAVETILAGLGRTDIPASGNLELQAKVEGTTKNPIATVNVSGSQLHAYNETLGTLNAEASFRDEQLNISRLHLDKPQAGGDGSLDATASYDLRSKQYQLQAKSNNLQLQTLTLPDGSAVRGTFDVQASGGGTTANPTVNATISAGNLQYAEVQLGTVQIVANVANQNAAIAAEAPKFNLSAKANVGLQEPNPATFEVTAANTDLGSLPVNLSQPLIGSVTAVVRGSGSLKNLQGGEASAEVSKLDLTWNKQPIRTEGPLVARYQNQVLTIDKATLVALDSRLSVDGTLPLDPKGAPGAIHVDGTVNLATVMAYIPTQQPVTARGVVSIQGTVKGTLKSIDPDLAVSLNDGYVTTPALNPPLADINLAARIRNGALELQRASADWGVASFTATGQVPFSLLPASLPVDLPRGTGPASFTASLKNLDLATIGGLPSNLTGKISLQMDAEAPKPELEAVKATVTFPELALRLGTYALEQQGTSTVTVSNGMARVDRFQLTGPATDIRLEGTAGLTGARPLDLRLQGTVDAAIASAFTDAVQARGTTEIRAAVTGSMANPQAEGYVQLTDAQLSLKSPRIGLDGLNARLDLTPNRLTLSRLEGSLNGGTLSGGGSIQYANGQVQATDLKVNADNVYLDFPEGLKSVSNVRLTARNTPDNIIVGGEVVIAEAGFTNDLNLDTGVLAAVTAPRGVDLTEERNPLLEKIQFDIAVRTDNPIVIDNNLAKAEVTADLRVLGNPYQPGLSGTLTIEEGGQIRLNEREYQVERGIITFNNERRIEPNMDIIATTTAAGFDIRLQISGATGKTETTLTSDPSLPEPDILAILLTGKRLDEIRGQEYEVARNQVLSYLTGRVGSQIGRGIEGATGLSMVRIEPNLIANETDPSARLTVGQDISNKLNLVYSMDLINSSDQIYVAEYDLSRRFVTRGVRQSDGSFRMDFRHDLHFGGIPEPKKTSKRDKRKIGDVSILGNTYFSDLKIADKFGAKEGKPYDFFKVRKGVDRVNKLYSKANLLEANVRLKREIDSDNTVDLNLNIDRGPLLDFVYEGIAVSDKEKENIREIWRSGVFDAQRAEEAVQSLRTWLMKDDYLQPEIQYTVSKPGAERKRVLFDIQPGAKYHDVALHFEGNADIDADTLRGIVKKQKLTSDVYVKPGNVTELLARYYAEQGYLDAKVDPPRYELDKQSATGKVVFRINAGPLYKIASVDFEGNSIFDDTRLRSAVPLPGGEAYRPVLRERSLRLLQDLYWSEGYNDVDVDVATRRNKNNGTVDVTVKVHENRKGVIKDIAVQGNERTSKNLIMTQLEVKPGDVLNLQKISNSRRNLYNTGAYSLVEIRRDEITEPDTVSAEKPIKLTVAVRELQPYQLRYGGFFDTERGPGGIVDFSNRNSLGSARNAGFRARYDSQLQEYRLYFSQPLLRRFPISTTASPFIRKERNPATATADPFNVDRIGFSLQQEARFRRKYVLNYGYRIERTRTYDTGPDPIFDVPLRIASLTSSVTRETRDELLDASKGSFVSQAFQWSPSVIGSELRFVKYFGQYFKYIPLQKPKVELFTNKIQRPRLIYAGAVRLGLSAGLGGQEVPLSERFFAGGGTTVRGFEQNSLGVVGPDRIPLGGEGMLVINNEIRFPVVSLFDGVGFVDIGNVYSKVSDFSFGDLRKAAGMGVRVRTPWVLIRLDYGFKLDTRPGETGRSRLFFSIGQAF